MELVVESDVYTPSIDATGNYIDKIPVLTKNEGIHCPCSRKDKIYNFSIKLSSVYIFNNFIY